MLSTGSGASSGGSAGVTKRKTKIVAKNLPGGFYDRPAFEGQRQSPRLNGGGGSGSKPSRAVITKDEDDKPMRQPGF